MSLFIFRVGPGRTITRAVEEEQRVEREESMSTGVREPILSVGPSPIKEAGEEE
jgi:hypothetical protein